MDDRWFRLGDHGRYLPKPMATDPENDIERHILGATVTHDSPFSTIDVPKLVSPHSREFRDKWVEPFYRASLFRGADEFTDSLRPIVGEITPQLLTSLLSDFNWRPRITAAYFAAILIETTIEDHIGRLLLRSDFCFAGNGYCLALARFNTPRSVDYIAQYLEYYLTRPDLKFNQGEALAALAHLDRANGTEKLDTFSKKWDDYTVETYTYERQKHIDRFEEQYAAVERIAADIGR